MHNHHHITLCSLLSHLSVVPCVVSHVSVVFVLCVLPRLPDSNKKVFLFFFLDDGLKKSVDTR